MADMYELISQAVGTDPKRIANQFANERIIPINGTVDRKMKEGVIKCFASMEAKSNDPITLLIDSTGGCMRAAMDTVWLIRSLHSPVDALVIGRCDSAAISIMLGCRKRKALANARFLIHCIRRTVEIVLDGELKEEEFRPMIQEALQLQKETSALYCERLNISPEKFRELCQIGEKFDLSYCAQTALKMKLIDEIVADFKFLKKQG